MSDIKNPDRIERAERVLEFYARDKGEPVDYYEPTDLIADLLHMEAQKFMDENTDSDEDDARDYAQRLLDRSFMHFTAEFKNPEEE